VILVGLGSNLDGPWGTPEQAVRRALAHLDIGPIKLVTVSPLMITAPFGVINQPNFVNAVAELATHLSPDALLRRLHMIEHEAGRQRRRRWGPRTLDLDLLDYHGIVRAKRTPSIKPLVLPHPGIAERLFVLEPINAIAPHWKHPLTLQKAALTIRQLKGLGRS
jgi:2-amino-4-hydroxy-6-hydroxymethyldihydropteridine diphosphokinase